MGSTLDRRPWLITLAAALAALAVIALAFRTGADQVEQWRLAARWTARVGFPIFIIAYVASSLYRLWRLIRSSWTEGCPSPRGQKPSWIISSRITSSLELWRMRS
jgi:hypothetical protein